MLHVRVLLLASLLVMTRSTEARAAGEGGVHSQGRGMCETDLDSFGGNFGSCISADATQGSRENPTEITIRSSTPMVLKVKCTPDASLPYVTCSVSAPSPSPVCAGFPDLYVLPGMAVKGSYDSTQGSSKSVVVACAGGEHSGPNNDGEINGAVGKCIGWFKYYKSKSKIGEFRSCLRMARADYCGMGCSITISSVLIHAFRATEEKTVACSELQGGCYEAAWNENGLANFSKLRWQTLSLQKNRIEALIKHEGKDPDAEQVCMVKCLAKIGQWELDSGIGLHVPPVPVGPKILENRTKHALGDVDCIVPPDLDFCRP